MKLFMAYIKALSYYLPEKVVTNEVLVRDFPEWSVDKVAAKVGVNSRHVAAENETAGDMAEKAAFYCCKTAHEMADVAMIFLDGDNEILAESSNAKRVLDKVCRKED